MRRRDVLELDVRLLQPKVVAVLGLPFFVQVQRRIATHGKMTLPAPDFGTLNSR